MSPRNAELNERMRREQQGQILRVARTVFARAGFHAAKVGDIARAAGVSHGLVYYYFPSKEDLFKALVADIMDGITRVVGAATMAPGTPWDRLVLLCRGMLEGIHREPEQFLIANQILLSDAVPDDARQMLQRHGLESMAAMVALVREGQTTGQIVAGDPMELTLTFWATVQGLAMSNALRPEGSRVIPASELVLRLLKA